MNGTLIDLPGITVFVQTIDLQDSTDQSHLIEIKDQHGTKLKVNVCFGRITEFELDPVKKEKK